MFTLDTDIAITCTLLKLGYSSPIMGPRESNQGDYKWERCVGDSAYGEQDQ